MTIEDVAHFVAEQIELWELNNETIVPLREWLGWSKEEYGKFLAYKQLPVTTIRAIVAGTWNPPYKK